MSAKSLDVTAKRWSGGWELHVDGHGVTQCRILDDAERQVRDYMHTLTDEPWTGPIELSIDLGGLECEVDEARASTAAAARLQEEAAAESRRVALALRGLGLSVTDSATILGVSRGRVSQLVKG
ncbi:MAG: antitoxin HicB [Austwickia sp.]|nr:antitoxin HicB [Actinomycetota bacterium]MCB1254965.1 antitoxin HicB [Austwickia sp.]MCO5308132.1 antitoxin HicB [Austwickia sp.]